MNINGKTTIFRKDFDGRAAYSMSISNKNQEGKYESMYIQVQLPKGDELLDKTKIEITKGFLSFYKTSEGLPKLKAIVQEYSTESQENFEEYGSDLPF